MFKIKCKHTKTESQKTQRKISFTTKDELDELDLLQIEKADGFLIFSPDILKTKVEDAMRDIKIGVEDRGMSPSKKLRGALYQFWYKKEQEKGIEWEDFYVSKIDGIIKMINDKL